jgi:hypothetical protein
MTLATQIRASTALKVVVASTALSACGPDDSLDDHTVRVYEYSKPAKPPKPSNPGSGLDADEPRDFSPKPDRWDQPSSRMLGFNSMRSKLAVEGITVQPNENDREDVASAASIGGVVTDQPQMEDWDEVEEAGARLAREILKYSKQHGRNNITHAEFQSILNTLCPLWPFC